MLKVHQFSKGVLKQVYRIENKLLCLVSQYCCCNVLLDYAFFENESFVDYEEISMKKVQCQRLL